MNYAVPVVLLRPGWELSLASGEFWRPVSHRKTVALLNLPRPEPCELWHIRLHIGHLEYLPIDTLCEQVLNAI